jgi:hypothetical protein
MGTHSGGGGRPSRSYSPAVATAVRAGEEIVGGATEVRAPLGLPVFVPAERVAGAVPPDWHQLHEAGGSARWPVHRRVEGGASEPSSPAGSKSESFEKSLASEDGQSRSAVSDCQFERMGSSVATVTAIQPPERIDAAPAYAGDIPARRRTPMEAAMAEVILNLCRGYGAEGPRAPPALGRAGGEGRLCGAGAEGTAAGLRLADDYDQDDGDAHDQVGQPHIWRITKEAKDERRGRQEEGREKVDD